MPELKHIWYDKQNIFGFSIEGIQRTNVSDKWLRWFARYVDGQFHIEEVDTTYYLQYVEPYTNIVLEVLNDIPETTLVQLMTIQFDRQKAKAEDRIRKANHFIELLEARRNKLISQIKSGE